MLNITLQRHCAKHIYVVPDGLRELMSDISREVLRNQPHDIYTFIADYLDALMITRENARVAARFVVELNECAQTIVNFLQRTGLKRNRADMITIVIQKAFRAHLERKGILREDEQYVIAHILEEADIPEDEAEAAAIVIQDAFREFKHRREKEQEVMLGIIDWRIAARSAIKLYRKTGASTEEAVRAANLIKAAYKGYYTRRAFLQLQARQEYGSYETTSSSSFDSTDHRKSVRIDMQSVIPHVDFGDSELIQYKGDDISTESTIQFVRDLISEAIVGPAIGEEPRSLTTLLKSGESISEKQASIEKLNHEELMMIAREIIEELLPLDGGEGGFDVGKAVGEALETTEGLQDEGEPVREELEPVGEQAGEQPVEGGEEPVEQTMEGVEEPVEQIMEGTATEDGVVEQVVEEPPTEIAGGPSEEPKGEETAVAAEGDGVVERQPSGKVEELAPVETEPEAPPAEE